jgi:beta-glucosidase
MKSKVMKVYAVSIMIISTMGFCNSRIFCKTEGKIIINYPYRNPKLPIEKRVKDLLSRMTLEEKIAQLQCEWQYADVKKILSEDSKGIGHLGYVLRNCATPREAAEEANRIQKLVIEKTRLGIPVIIHDEGLHGLTGCRATSFPQAIGLAATWDPELIERVASVIAKESKSRGIRQLLSPVINIARDARWGRVEETYGEDPYLTSRMGVAFCRALEREGVISTPKHFAANVGDGGRDSNAVHFSERLLREIYFPAFKACVQEGGATSVMAAYNSLDGVPCSANKWLLTEVLRKEWGFRGFVVSDYGSVGHVLQLHRTAATEKDAAKQTIEAGLDVELPQRYIYGEPLLEAVKEGLVKEETIDRAVSRVLEAKFMLGLFENPYVDPDYADKISDCDEHRKLALQAAREAIVLLKNENNVLPLRKDIGSIAVIGPNANKAQLGGYSGWSIKVVTVLEGIKNKISSATKVFYTEGCDIVHKNIVPIPKENFIPTEDMRAKGYKFGLKAEYFNNMDLSGEPVLVRVDDDIDFTWLEDSPDPAINKDKFSVRWRGKIVPPVSKDCTLGVTTDDGVRLYIDGKLIIDSWYDRPPKMDTAVVKFEAGREYEICMEYYENGGGAVATLGWDIGTDSLQGIKKAAEMAQKCDVAVIVVGIIEGEGKDRAELTLPGQQEELIKKVAETGTPTIVVLINGGPVVMENWINCVQGIIEAWYPGEEGGNAIAEVLFGDYNPGGKLPITFPRAVGQVPLYYNYKPSGRGYDYVDFSGKPRFPFGYGLSYTQFEYTNLKIEPLKMKLSSIKNNKGKITISVDVQNVGNYKGDEVVQLYLRDTVSSLSRPVKELKGFKRITLAPGEKQTVAFALSGEDLSFLDANLKYIVEPGTFEVMVGSSSEDIRIWGDFEILE